METFAAWLAVPVALALVGAVASVRVVGEHHRLVVARLGRTHRVVGPGVHFHVPLLEQVTLISLGTSHAVVSVPAVTLDGVAVHVTGALTLRIDHPERASTADPDGLSLSLFEVETEIVRAISHLDLIELLPARTRLESAVPQEVNATTAQWGTRVLTLELSEFETRLTAELISGARGPRGSHGS